MPPATRPTVLETLATNGGYPKNSNVGKVIRVPAPTMVLMVPAAIPAPSRAMTSYQGTRPPYESDRVLQGTGVTCSSVTVPVPHPAPSRAGRRPGPPGSPLPGGRTAEPDARRARQYGRPAADSLEDQAFALHDSELDEEQGPSQKSK